MRRTFNYSPMLATCLALTGAISAFADTTTTVTNTRAIDPCPAVTKTTIIDACPTVTKTTIIDACPTVTRTTTFDACPAVTRTTTTIDACPAVTRTTTIDSGPVVNRTTTINSSASLLLPSATYVVVDPLTGAIRGDYTIGTKTLNGIPLNSSYVVMDKLSRRVIGTFDENGDIIDLNVAPAAGSVIVSVDSHRAALEKQIDSLLLQGQITASQAETVRLDIARLFPATEETTTTRTVTYSSALTQDSGLYSVEGRLLPMVQKSFIAKAIAPRFVTINGQLVLPDDLTYRKLQLERRIDDEFALGHMTKDQLLQLKADMNVISTEEAQFRAGGGGSISDANAAIMAADLDAVQAKMDRYTIGANAGGANAGLKIGAN